MDIEITDDDISYAEALLLPPDCTCNDERRTFIRCMESRDVVACPGSGKTTALLAKLLILARKMPFADGRGVCVLTHTNVGIDTIKERAALASASLFAYPNYFGTIQRFVDHFLATPCYASEFSKPIVAIDNERFYWELGKLYHADYGLQRWLDCRGGLEALGGYWFHPDTLLVGETLDAPLKKPGQGTASYKKIQSMRRKVLDQGILSYNDAYAIALRYCLRTPNLAQAMSSRFCILFLDEAQDTDAHQFRVLDEVFAPEQVVVQRIGDPNQAIYHDRVRSDGYWSPTNPLCFSDSLRYGPSIARLLGSVRVDDRIALQPCETTPSHPPCLLTFKPGEEQNAIAAFSRVIEESSGTLPLNGTYKAVGWIGKDNTSAGALCIPSYYPAFDRSKGARNKRLTNLISYAARATRAATAEGPKVFLQIILQSVAGALNAAGLKDEVTGRHHTPRSVHRLWAREHEQSYGRLRQQLAQDFLLALKGDLSPTALRDHIKPMIETTWSLFPRPTTYLDGDTLDLGVDTANNTAHPSNQFVADNGTIIHVGTVHSVKGETHTGTLLMETEYYGKTDAERLAHFLEGSRPTDELRKARHKENLKIAHVAFSRPTHLLALACRCTSVAGHEEALLQNGWLIRTVSELTAEGREAE